MIKLMSVGVATAVFLACSFAAYAEQTTGIISSVNSTTGTLGLQSGETFNFDNPASLRGLLPGERVGVFHNGSQGVNAYDPHPAHRDNIDIN
ncbi:hypothetical protein OSH11_16185 [Kaistia dalseonensis]|uniref:Uncharacterized protein n=1 Tax=Kaistia dalseonensis TaxID=410840 RepID=A0ABU0HBI3_9HYPH|nr:hypothetical protein [Kaistia dalseonensis]MCX5496248.1 hypothetical protein [Kaistia dalseonensis]MDQ0438866.1 hypothetical protein [Kaistia dalseonensis]